MKLLVIGHGRHGKDTVCERLRDVHGLKFESSSVFCAKLFIYETLKDSHGYNSYEDCYKDRHNHRGLWFSLIHDYCKQDYARLGREIFAENDVYCGLRNKSEFHAMRNTGVFDYAIWVDRSNHCDLEPSSSMNLEPWMADYVIDNNGTLDQLNVQVDDLINYLKTREVKYGKS